MPPLCYAQSTKSCPPPLARALFGGMSIQAVHLSGGALTLGLAAALLCAGCAPLPSASQGSSASQVSTVSASLAQISSLRGGSGPPGAGGGLSGPGLRRGILPVRAQRCGRLRADSRGPGHRHLYRGSGPGGGHRLRSPALHHQGHALNPDGRIHRWDAAVLLSSSSNFGGPGLRLKALKDHQKALPLQP